MLCTITAALAAHAVWGQRGGRGIGLGNITIKYSAVLDFSSGEMATVRPTGEEQTRIVRHI